MIIYADILFLVNFIMDYMSLYVCKKVLDIIPKRFGLFLGALLGGIYSVLCLYINIPEPISAIIVSLIMCYLAFGKRKITVFIKSIVLFYSTGMLFGGVMTFLQNVLYEYRNAKLFENGLTAQMFFLLAGIVFVFVMCFSHLFKTYMYKKSICVEVCFENQSKKLNLLCDTGNLLRDPYTDLPVIVIKSECLDAFFGDSGIHRIPDKAQAEDLLKYKVRYIPIKTSAGKALLPALRADSTYICTPHGKKTEIQTVLACDGVSGSSYGDYDGIIPYAIGLEA